MLDLTTFILTQNNRRTIKACLDSVAWCNEVVIIDSFSTDETLEIARTYPNVKIHQHLYTNAREQRIWGMSFVNTKWTFILDSDEECPPVLRDKIIELVQNDDGNHDGYVFLTRTYFLGKLLTHRDCMSGMGKRLVLTAVATRYEKDVRVHARVVLNNPKKLPYKYYLIHNPIDTLSQHFTKMIRYARWQAEDMYDNNKRINWWNVTLQPAWKFFRFYILQGGIRDGLQGLVICCLGAIGVVLKYVFYAEMLCKKDAQKK